jgi:hypothetical protein
MTGANIAANTVKVTITPPTAPNGFFLAKPEISRDEPDHNLRIMSRSITDVEAL